MGLLFAAIAPFYDLLFAAVQKHQQEVILANLELGEGEKVLDIGGGTGKLAYALFCRGARVSLLDQSAAMLKQAAKRLPREQVFRGEATALPFKDNYFDSVLMVDTLHHLPARRKALGEAWRVLKEDGNLYILDFDGSFPLIRFLGLVEKFLGEPGKFFAPAELEEMLRKTGYTRIYGLKPSRYELLVKASKPACPP